MTRDEAKQKLDLAKSGAFGQDRRHQMLKIIDQIYISHETELKAKDEEIKNLKAMAQNMCAECECAKFADNAIKPSEMWELHTMLKGNK